MKTGFRVYSDFRRADEKLIKELSDIPSANISDSMNRMYAMYGGIRPFNGKKIAGSAVTVKLPAGDNLAAQAAIDIAQKGDVIVIDCGGCTRRAMVGGMMIAYRQKKGIRGFVVDGAVRDIDDINNSTLAVYSKASTPRGPYRNGPGEINVPVVCGGQAVMPGDIIIGDNDGIVVIPRQQAQEVLDAAKGNLLSEQKELEKMRRGIDYDDSHREKFLSPFLRD